jgi:CBS domain-containing protein
MSIQDMSIASFMTTNVKTARANQTIREVCKNMHDQGIGSLVILRDNDNTTTTGKPGGEYHKAVGIVTERDVVSYLGSDRALSLRTQISEIMSTPIIAISPTNSLKDAIETMQLRNIRRLPVIDSENNNEKMVGVVTDKDILRAIMKTMPSSLSAVEGMLNDQLHFGYRFMYERFINEDHFSKDTHPGIS